MPASPPRPHGMNGATMTTKTTEVFVQGMTCQGCVRSVQRSLAAIAGVTRVDVDLATGRAVIDHDGRPTPDDISRVLTKIGFTVGGAPPA